ncbi:hypothetical protein ACIBU0_17895 [Streptomyces sp. NPDC049627]|uniref:hypothetical protein n=1 Tax=Streptomyces sp. NPDC049627 TaxID=3365595 RepID=UPI0037B48AA4
MRNRLRKTFRTGLVAGVALAVTAGFAGSASAGTIVKIRVSGGTGTFLDAGDRVECHDTKADGYGVRTYAESMVHGEEWMQTASCWGGKDDLVQSGNAGFVEGARVKVKVCYIKRGVGDVRCTGYRYATA